MIRFGARKLFPSLNASFGKAAINLKELRQQTMGNTVMEPVDVTRKASTSQMRAIPIRELTPKKAKRSFEAATEGVSNDEATEHLILAPEARAGFFKTRGRFSKSNRTVSRDEGNQDAPKAEPEMSSEASERKSHSAEQSSQEVGGTRSLYTRGRSQRAETAQAMDPMKWIEEEAKRDKGFVARIRGKSTVDELFYYLGRLKGAKSSHQCAGLARIIALTKLEKRRYAVQSTIGKNHGPEDKKFVGNKVQLIWQDGRMIKLAERINAQIQNLNSESVLVLLKALNSSESLSEARNRLMCGLFKYVPLLNVSC